MRFSIFGLAAALAGGLPVVVRGDSWTAVFPGVATPSVAIPVEDGRHFLSVAIPGAQAEQGKLKAEGAASEARTQVDPVSRLVVFTIDGAAAPGAMSLRNPAPLGAGFSLLAPGEVRGTTLEWVKQVDGKVLPLALLKVHYSDKPPAPGTPLLDGSGNLVAIAYTAAAGNDGYAVPAEVAKHVVDAVMRDGAIDKARLGLTLQPSNKQPRVERVLADSPASRAGILVGDVLSEVGGRKIGDYADAVNAFYFLRPSTTVGIKLVRGGQTLSVSLTPEGAAAR